MSEARTNEIWILGATGRVGQALAARLSDKEVPDIVLVGRSEQRLRTLAERLKTNVRTLVLDGPEAITEAVRKERPRLVMNLLGSYAQTAPALARACLPGGAYVDLANDLTALTAIIDMDEEAKRTHSTLISGAGFGVLGTEAVVAHLCLGRAAPSAVRVDALASFASHAGVMGEAFAQTAVDVITTGGRSYRDGQLVPTRLASNLQRHTLPDGTTCTSAAVPSGELFAAHLVSRAPNVEFTSALAPTAPMVRALLPLMTRLLRVPAMRRLMIRQMAASKTKAAPRPRPYSWGHAVITWPDGTVREGWLRTGDAMDYTADALAAIVAALTGDTAPHGAFTPAAALGEQIAIDAGGTLIDA